MFDFKHHISQFTPEDFNTFVYTGINTTGDESKRIGRLVQVRLESGAFGSHQVLLRHDDDTLICHENQAFFRITNDKELERLQERFKDTSVDKETEEYTLAVGEPETGFIIPSKIPANESTPMRDILGSIKKEISKKMI